ncbi:MAG: hypothetical protein EU544_01145 [Promethearchaeota archaeon]|nr:MAG: hypothetical protein EU544_01145 [Candidatus Lokiarchaeota archaeon]
MTPFKLKSVRKKLGRINRNIEGKNYSLTPFLKNLLEKHQPEYTYLEKQSDLSFSPWKQIIRDMVKEKLRLIDPLPPAEQDLIIYAEAKKNRVNFIKLSLTALKGLRIPAILCIPEKLSKEAPVMVCLHGHYPDSKETITGLKRSKTESYFAYELAKKGIITLSLDWIGMGERERFKHKLPMSRSYEGHRSNWIRFIGLDMIGLRITEVIAFINYLSKREEIDSSRIGIIGHSGGGTLALFTSIVEKRIKLCATSGYFGTWQDSILGMYHCGCNYIGDLGKFAELYDIYAALAPLPLAVCIGEKDNIFPLSGTKRAIPILQKAYQDAEASNHLMIDVHPKAHKFEGRKMYPFILRHL